MNQNRELCSIDTKKLEQAIKLLLDYKQTAEEIINDENATQIYHCVNAHYAHTTQHILHLIESLTASIRTKSIK